MAYKEWEEDASCSSLEGGRGREAWLKEAASHSCHNVTLKAPLTQGAMGGQCPDRPCRGPAQALCTATDNGCRVSGSPVEAHRW